MEYGGFGPFNSSTVKVLVYPKSLDRLGLGYTTGNLGMDPIDSRWPAYDAILAQAASLPDSTRPVLLPEDSEALKNWSGLASSAEEWIEDAKRIAVAGYRQVLGDGQAVCSLESEAEYNDHGDELTGVYAPGTASSASSMLTTEQANALRAAGRAGGLAIVVAAGENG
jgi:hypothetical protein